MFVYQEHTICNYVNRLNDYVKGYTVQKSQELYFVYVNGTFKNGEKILQCPFCEKLALIDQHGQIFEVFCFLHDKNDDGFK